MSFRVAVDVNDTNAATVTTFIVTNVVGEFV